MEPLSPAPSVAAPAEPDRGPSTDPPAAVAWYHLDPDVPYRELRLGVTPGLTRALMVGGGLAVGLIALMFILLWIGWIRGGGAMPVPN